jgi:hypothetical protein
MAQPDYDVCSEYDRKDSNGVIVQKLHKIGVGWNSKNGGSINCQLEAHPIGARLVLFPFKPKGGSEAP